MIISNVGLHDGSMVKALPDFVDLSNSIWVKHGVEFIIHSPTYVNLTIDYAKTHTNKNGSSDGEATIHIVLPDNFIIFANS